MLTEFLLEKFLGKYPYLTEFIQLWLWIIQSKSLSVRLTQQLFFILV